MHKLLPLLVVAGIISAVLLSPLKRNFVYKLKLTNDTTTACVDQSQLTNATGDFDSSATIAFFDGHDVDYPKTSLLSSDQQQSDNQDVLGAKTADGKEKWIEISLDQQKLRAWEGDQIVKEFPISSGKWWPTPKGDFAVYWKLRYIRMKGGSKDLGTYYDLPNVPDTMFFYGSYGIHGAYWHNNFGQPMSHGCVNEPLNEAHWLFEWAGPTIRTDQNSVRATKDNPGSRVFIQ